MGSAFRLREVADSHFDFTINSKKAAEIQLGIKKQAYISFGDKKCYVNVKISDAQAEDEILLSKNVMGTLHLPDYIIYEVRVNKNEIRLGPCIGFLISSEDEKLTEARLKKMLIYTREYSKVKGALVIFALDRVDTVNRLVEGYCYNPLENCWKRGVFPYPSSIFRNIGLSKEWKNHFLSAVGDTVFNNRYFNKREMYEWFSSQPGLKAYIPYTILYKSCEDVTDMLGRFGKVFIKPVSGMKGRGIVQVSKEGESVVFRFRDRGKNNRLILNNREEIWDYIEKSFGDRKYLIQQSIDLLKYEGGIVDFRCVIQKNQSDTWVCTAVFGRLGERDSVVSNISSGGTPFAGEELLEIILAPLKIDAGAIREKIEGVVQKVCNTLDEFGFNLGILGLDIAIDVSGRIWLIEINNRDPCPVFAMDIGNEQLYYRLKTNPVFYAKALAGFKEG